MEWIGYWLDYSKFQLGISEKRLNWLIQWIDKMMEDGLVLMRRFAEGLGRLSFTAQAVFWLKPSLAILYTWSASAPGGAVWKIPSMVRCALTYLKSELLVENCKLYCGAKSYSEEKELFLTDAKCENTRVVLGGWDTSKTSDTRKARWFSLELTPSDVPWLFRPEKGSSWSSTSAELLATWVALQVFTQDVPQHGLFRSAVAGTDNQANEGTTENRSSTKWPLCVVMMQLSSTMKKRNMLLKVKWRPREFNQDADDLTNAKFHNFDPTLQIRVQWESLCKPVIDLLAPFNDEFSKHLSERPKRREFFQDLLLTKRQKLETKTAWEA